jgi:hypothetical protein
MEKYFPVPAGQVPLQHLTVGSCFGPPNSKRGEERADEARRTKMANRI